MTRPIYILQVGLPGSGKSTRRKEIIEAWQGYGDAPVVLSTDDLIEDYALSQGLSYNQVFESKIKWATDVVNYDRTWAFRRNDAIIHDQTNLSQKKRAGILALIPSCYRKVCLFETVPESVRLSRCSQRVGKLIPDHINASMLASFVPPSIDEGFDIVAPGSLWWTILRDYRVDRII